MILSSASLQKKATVKLGPGLWWADEKSLQQASPWQVAMWKAQWFAGDSIYDYCCGLGGDAIQLARMGSTTVVDSDEVVLNMAIANVRNHAAGADAQAICAIVDESTKPGTCRGQSSVHIDPDRRTGGSRVTNPDYYSPDWNAVLAITDQALGAWIKLAPAAHVLKTPDTHHQMWISLSGSVREQSLITGAILQKFAASTGLEIESGCRSAVMIKSDGQHCLYQGSVDEHAEEATGVGEIMVDPDAAIRAAGLTEAFASDFGLQVLGGPAGFLTGTEFRANHRRLEDLGICEQVVWSGACDDRKIRRELRAQNAFPVRVKTRGVKENANQLEKKLRNCGDDPVTLWIGRRGKKQFAVFTKPTDSV